MARQILVVLKKAERIDEAIAYVKRITQPGMTVVFLLRYPVDGFEELLRAGWTTEETGIHNLRDARKIVERYSWEGQERLARQKVFRASEALQKKGAEVDVDVYSGSPRRVVSSYAVKGDVHLIIMRAGNGLGIIEFLHRVGSVFGLFRRPSLSPVRLVHPGTLL